MSITRKLVMLLVICLMASPASAFWQRVEMRDGAGSIVFAADKATGSAIGVACEGGQLKAVAQPVPAGASGRVSVAYEIDGQQFVEDWTVERTRIVAEGPDASRFVARLQAMKSDMWFQIGGQPRSLATADGLHEKLGPTLARCGRGS